MADTQTLEGEIAVAREVQLSTLPDFMPDMAGYDVAGAVWPAEETGGDTFDLVALDDSNMFVLLADATGHGIGPALSALQVASMLRGALRLGASLDDGFRHINAQLVEDLPADRFVTACFGLMNTRNHRFSFHSAGQGPILHYRTASNEFEWHDPSCFPLGFIEHQERYTAREMQLAPGDILGLISDGIYEYENDAGELFGMEGVSRVLQEHHQLPMAQLVDTLYQAAADFGGTQAQRDDVTIVFVKHTGESMDEQTCRREFARSLDSLEDIFSMINQFLVSRGIETSLSFAVELAVDELFTNMVTYNADEPRDILVELGQVENGLRVSLTDYQDPPFDVTTEAPEVDVNLPAAEREEGGLGLHLVREMVDALDYVNDEGRCTVTFIKKPG